MKSCTCGHLDDEHEGGRTISACAIEDCDCIAFDWDGEDGETP